MNIVSLGAGVQSSVMALMAAHGELGPMPDCAIFADTQFEPASVYTHLDWLETQLPFPVHRVTAGNIKTDTISGLNTTGQKFSVIPFFTGSGMGRRQCTREYKISPIRRKISELLVGKKNAECRPSVDWNFNRRGG
jgi:3'-phosphoadenosine 5'-phosphosulfate sulfotransferase (PAPS reductase)/FAD synthetase